MLYFESCYNVLDNGIPILSGYYVNILNDGAANLLSKYANPVELLFGKLKIIHQSTR